jgi:hypothetical protein
MLEVKTHFAQVPVEVVRRLVGVQISETAIALLPCRICANPVRLEDSKTDASGQAVHEGCYVASLTSATHSRQRAVVRGLAARVLVYGSTEGAKRA